MKPFYKNVSSQVDQLCSCRSPHDNLHQIATQNTLGKYEENRSYLEEEKIATAVNLNKCLLPSNNLQLDKCAPISELPSDMIAGHCGFNP